MEKALNSPCVVYFRIPDYAFTKDFPVAPCRRMDSPPSIADGTVSDIKQGRALIKSICKIIIADDFLGLCVNAQ